MLIANPIYDLVFKYLMSNLDIAKGVISAIIGEEILTLSFQTLDNIHKSETGLSVLHLDFAAKIRTKDGKSKNVLIELQKSNLAYNIMRFRKYLGQSYQKEDDIFNENGTVSTTPLPIVTIYFLGFYISKDLPAVIKVDRRYIDVLAGKEIHIKNDFIEQLSHNSYVIQIPALNVQLRSPLEDVLSVFQQENFISEDHRLKGYIYDPNSDLMKKILRKLMSAASDAKLHRELELEEMAEKELENTLGKTLKQLHEKEITIAKQKKALEEKEIIINNLREELGKLKR